MITENDLHKGLKFRACSDYYTIYNDDCTMIEGLDIYPGYTKKEMCRYFNDGSWIIIKEKQKIYELW